jgi:aspartyl-tRNA(Asn)/glutamyl-tRNA(Gln) amidotransferase subunit A
MYLADIFTVGPSLAGLPAISIPVGFNKAGLPIGLQIIGRRFNETDLLAFSSHFCDK